MLSYKEKLLNFNALFDSLDLILPTQVYANIANIELHAVLDNYNIPKGKHVNFIQRFLDFTSEYESPTSFWVWSSYALIAATMRDNCYYEHGLSRTYPNIYVILLAESAEYRKSGSFKPVSKLIQEMKHTKLIEGRASVQGIIDELSQDTSQKGGQPIRGGSCLILAEELAAFFVNDPQLIPLITTMYDFRENYPYKLRSNSINVKNLCLTMLAASNSTFLKDVYTLAAKYGGLLGRTLMVRPDETRPPNDLLDVDTTKYDYKELIDELNEIKKLKGRFTVSPAAHALYKEWYNALYKSYKKYPDATGVTQRIHNNALKIAMIIAASRGTLLIELDVMGSAIEQVISLRGNYMEYEMSTGKSDKAAIGAIVLSALWESKDKQITRQALMFKHWKDFTADELDELIKTLDQAGLIITTADGSSLSYKMTEKCIEVFDKK